VPALNVAVEAKKQLQECSCLALADSLLDGAGVVQAACRTALNLALGSHATNRYACADSMTAEECLQALRAVLLMVCNCTTAGWHIQPESKQLGG
jgi:hypothetical protein